MSVTLESIPGGSSRVTERAPIDEVIAERLQRFRETMQVIYNKKVREAGTGPTPSEIREMAYEERESSVR